jgi:hypothetical protein
MPELERQPGECAELVAAPSSAARGSGTAFRKGAEFILHILGSVARSDAIDPPAAPVNWRLVTALCLSVSVALMMIALGHYFGRRAESWAPFLFWGGLLLLFLPVATRIASPAVSRDERILLLLLTALSTFALKLLFSPTAFVHFDEFLHWVTARDILESGRLFLENSLLPVSPLYPGLEILTTALVNLTGLSIFPASVLMLAVLRSLFVCVLFLLYERTCGSPRIAAIACLVYMGHSGFVAFDTLFAYQSLAVVLLVLALLAEAISEADPNRRWGSLLTMVVPFLIALAVTHHVTAYFAAVFLVSLAVLEFLRSNTGDQRVRIGFVAISAVAMAFLWSSLTGNFSTGYLGPVFERSMDQLLELIDGSSRGAREFFVAKDGTRTPAWLQVTGIASVALIALGLTTGFLRSLAMSSPKYRQNARAGLADFVLGRWRESRIVLLTLMTLGLPISIALRLTSSGWEIGNRMGSFVFLGVGLVVSVSIVCFWYRRDMRWWRAPIVGVALAVIILGGIITGWGVLAVRSPYRVSADALSVEPMGVEAASWTRTWLGEGNRFAADRVNRLLLATYGRQDIVTSLYDKVETAALFSPAALSANGLATIRRGNIEYLLVDLRLTEAAPSLGVYFEQGEARTITVPLEPEALLKFNNMDLVGRIFDNGWIVIFDVRGLRDAR